MKLPQKRRDALYAVVCDEIMDIRCQFSKELSTEIDAALYQAQNNIWRRVCAALDLEDES